MGGAAAFALAVRVPQVLVGLTVVAFGTSAPEVVVGIEAAREGLGDVAVGNVVGSNVANVGLNLGASALILPAQVERSLRRRALPVLVGSAALLAGLMLDGQATRFEGLTLVGLAFAYTALMLQNARTAADVAVAVAETTTAREAADAAGAHTVRSPGRSLLAAAVGVAVLLLGGSLFLSGAVGAARALGMSERLVGLTVVVLGTSWPEMISSIIAARRGHSERFARSPSHRPAWRSTWAASRRSPCWPRSSSGPSAGCPGCMAQRRSGPTLRTSRSSRGGGEAPWPRATFLTRPRLARQSRDGAVARCGITTDKESTPCSSRLRPERRRRRRGSRPRRRARW
ncbi:MAG: sodium:calcium antiporter [Deltaproteobacteria bacterium]|nr:sodium:calcium antiporter [Deltaproteobacteria bacterium]